jgi:hypothetical protein
MIIRPSNHLLANLESRDCVLLELAFQKDRFIRHFILSPNFVSAVLGVLFSTLQTYPKELLHSFLAFTGRFARVMDVGLSYDGLDAEYKNGTRAVMALRQAGQRPFIEVPELMAIITLAVGVISFDLMEFGQHSHNIARSMMRLTLQMHPSIPSIPGTNLAILPLVYLDTCNCIVRRKIPVESLYLDDPDYVNHYIGICVPLLPLLFEICRASHDLACLTRLNHGVRTEMEFDIERRLRAIESAILSWKPIVSASALAQLTPAETTIVEAQARIHQQAALLIIHRLRFAPGTQDEPAYHISQDILKNIDILRMPTQQPKPIATGRLDEEQATPSEGEVPIAPFEYRQVFPFLVASVEADSLTSRTAVLDMLPFVIFSKLYPRLSVMLKEFLLFVWAARDRGCSSPWFDLATMGPPFVLF